MYHVRFQASLTNFQLEHTAVLK